MKNCQKQSNDLLKMHKVKKITKKYLSSCTKNNDKLKEEWYNQRQESRRGQIAGGKAFGVPGERPCGGF